MRIYCNLPDQIKSKGKIFKLNATLSAKEQVPINKRYRTVLVLSRNLRGKTDLHRNPYKPHKFIYTEV